MLQSSAGSGSGSDRPALFLLVAVVLSSQITLLQSTAVPMQLDASYLGDLESKTATSRAVAFATVRSVKSGRVLIDVNRVLTASSQFALHAASRDVLAVGKRYIVSFNPPLTRALSHSWLPERNKQYLFFIDSVTKLTGKFPKLRAKYAPEDTASAVKRIERVFKKRGNQVTVPKITTFASRVDNRWIEVKCCVKSLLDASVRWLVTAADQAVIPGLHLPFNQTTVKQKATFVSTFVIRDELLRYGTLNVTCIASNILGHAFRHTVVEGTHFAMPTTTSPTTAKTTATTTTATTTATTTTTTTTTSTTTTPTSTTSTTTTTTSTTTTPATTTSTKMPSRTASSVRRAKNSTRKASSPKAQTQTLSSSSARPNETLPTTSTQKQTTTSSTTATTSSSTASTATTPVTTKDFTTGVANVTTESPLPSHCKPTCWEAGTKSCEMTGVAGGHTVTCICRNNYEGTRCQVYKPPRKRRPTRRALRSALWQTETEFDTSNIEFVEEGEQETIDYSDRLEEMPVSTDLDASDMASFADSLRSKDSETDSRIANAGNDDENDQSERGVNCRVFFRLAACRRSGSEDSSTGRTGGRVLQPTAKRRDDEEQE